MPNKFRLALVLLRHWPILPSTNFYQNWPTFLLKNRKKSTGFATLARHCTALCMCGNILVTHFCGLLWATASHKKLGFSVIRRAFNRSKMWYWLLIMYIYSHTYFVFSRSPWDLLLFTYFRNSRSYRENAGALHQLLFLTLLNNGNVSLKNNTSIWKINQWLS